MRLKFFRHLICFGFICLALAAIKLANIKYAFFAFIGLVVYGEFILNNRSVNQFVDRIVEKIESIKYGGVIIKLKSRLEKMEGQSDAITKLPYPDTDLIKGLVEDVRGLWGIIDKKEK
ncbi:MAG TPA: hypothetical protein DCL44_09705 [Elusimicrobia bacterium]|nr:hypothetical protein [Elusimicrobiota bacterium]